ncbi:MAG: rhodanese-like domain-containing protein [bacterium]
MRSLARLVWWLPFGRVPEIGADDLAAGCSSSSPPQILDVRTRREWRESRIPGARNVPITSLKARLAGLGLDRERAVVAICRSAHRSVGAVRLLQRAGFADARQLRGGMKAWWDARLPTESS